MQRYHPALVFLHWILALMIMMGLIMGNTLLTNTPNSDPQKLLYLKMHMSAGMVILLLMSVRLVIRYVTTKPPQVDIGHPLLNKFAPIIHYLFYAIVILMAASGLATANLAGLADNVFNGSTEQLPATFEVIPALIAHRIFGLILFILLISHVLAFIYHQFIHKGDLFSRIWFGQRIKENK